MPDDSTSLVTVARFDRLHEAQLAKARLDSAGINSMISNPDMSGLSGMFDAENNQIRVMVSEDDAEEARAVLD